MKKAQRDAAISLRMEGYSLSEIVKRLGVSKSSVSIWVRDVELSAEHIQRLSEKGFLKPAVEARRISRLKNEKSKRDLQISNASSTIAAISTTQLKLIGTMLYWAEGGKTQRMVRFSNGDPEMIKIMMAFFRRICAVDENAFRGYIHIHPHLNPFKAEEYWSTISGIPLKQFYKTYTKPNKSSQNKKDSLPYGVFDIYIMDVRLFLKITGWSKGIFAKY